MMVKQISKYKGFTLVEILVVVALVAILAGIALPAYQSQVLRGKRAEAKALLMDIVSRQERYYTQNSSYATSITDANGLNISDSSENDHYTATMTTSPGGCGPTTSPFVPCVGYALTATPVAADNECTSITLTSTGVRGSTGTASEEICWR